MLFCAITSLLPGAAPDPRRELEAALEKLKASGTYSWRESRQLETQRQPVEPFGFGRTTVNGYTFATLIWLNNARVAFREREVAIQTPAGWRRSSSLDDREIETIWPGLHEKMPNLPTRVRRLAHTPLHVLLPVILPLATRLQRDDGDIVGEIGAGRSHWGLVYDLLLWGGSPHFIPGRGVMSQSHDGGGSGVIFRARLQAGAIQRVEITLTMPHPGRTTPGGEPLVYRNVFVIDIVETGFPKPEPDPEVEALLGSPPQR